MSFSDITRDSLDVLTLHYRIPGVLPGPVPPARGDAGAAADPTRFVASQAFRVIPFQRVEAGARAFARQYQVTLRQPLDEPEFTARASSAPWSPGVTTPFGEELEAIGARFKKLSTVLRVDPMMDPDVTEAQKQLAHVALARSMEEAFWHSFPPNDDTAHLSGLRSFLAASQEVLYDPARGMVGGLSEAEVRCHPSDGDLGAPADLFVMSANSRWRLTKEMEDAGLRPDFAYCALTGRRQLHFHGVPVLEGRVPEPAGGAGTDAWALKIFGPSGVRIVHVGGRSSDYGIRARTIGPTASLDAAGEARSATEAVEVFAVVSVLVPEPASIARLTGIPVGDPFSQP